MGKIVRKTEWMGLVHIEEIQDDGTLTTRFETIPITPESMATQWADSLLHNKGIYKPRELPIGK
jgi:hypothetical protein